MASLFPDLDPAQLLASPMRPVAPSVDFQLDDLFNYDGFMMDDWLAASQDVFPVDGSMCHSLPLSGDGSPSESMPSPSGYYADNVKLENAGTGESNNGSDGTHSSDGLNVQDVDSFGTHAPATLLPSNPSTKKRKIRPKDKLESLQKQLDDIMAQVEQLTLVNERLHCKNDVLTSLLECSDEVELISAAAPKELEACIRDPTGPHLPVILTMHNLTPQSWLAFYNGKLAEVSRCLIGCSDPDQVASREAVTKLSAVCKDLFLHLEYAINLRRDVMCEAKRITHEQFAHKHREEEFWGDVVRALELTPAQEQRIVQACDVYERCNARLNEQREGLGGAIVCQVVDCGTLLHNQTLLEQVTSNLMRCQHLIKGLCHWLYGRALTPQQTAKCLLHAHPILPCPILLMTAVTQEVGSRRPLPPAAAVEPFAPRSKGVDWTSAHVRSGLATQVR